MEAHAQVSQTREGIKETITSVVVAFILAFVFRAFIVEAFVIPTGSMAATLYGKHGTITCEECGWEYAYGLADLTRQQNGATRRNVRPDSRSVCQNCAHVNTNLEVNDFAGPIGNAEGGDRILVHKWLFDLGDEPLGPQRWDVTVFKDPGPGGENFIKRLVGLAGEVLEIIDGDVYTVPVEELSETTLTALRRLRHVKYLNRPDAPGAASREEQLQAEHEWPAARKEIDAKLRILRKTPSAQAALWTMVYDHDYPVRHPDPGQPRWEPDPDNASAWDTSDRKARVNGGGMSGGFLRFAGKPINDICAYNMGLLHKQRWNPVSDLRLEFVLIPRGGGGLMMLGLSKYADTFWARIGTDGVVALYRTGGDLPGDGTDPLCQNRLDPLPTGQPIEVAYQCVDYRVSLLINGTEVLATTDQQFAADPSSLRADRRGPSTPPRIWASDLDLELWHLVLRRDVYYSSLGNDKSVPVSARTGWGTEGNPIWLGPGEYFMLGDNSAASKDSRLWTEPGKHLQARGEAYQVGTVPRDQLVGRAFFVYWPSGHRSDVLPLLRNRGLIPNFGRMRWIR